MNLQTSAGNPPMRSSRVSPAEMALVGAWRDLLLGTLPGAGPDRYPADAPFSFFCGQRSSRDWLKLAEASCESSDWNGDQRFHQLRWSDPVTGLVCILELTEFRNFPALEWVVRLRNDGLADTEPVANFKALDISWKAVRQGEMPELRRAFGSDGRHDDFQYVCDELRQSMWTAKRTIRMDTATNTAFRQTRSGFNVNDGRSTATWLPFFNLRTGEDGLIGAVGWSGHVSMLRS